MKSDYMMCGRKAVGRVRFASMDMKIRRLRGFLLGSVAALLLLCASPGKAQTFRGTILGTVTDSSGAAVGGAKVTIKNTDTGLTREVTTTDDGSYAVPELPIGNYSVTVEKSGFKTAVVSGIHVEVSSERRADVALQARSPCPAVEVSGEALPLGETTFKTLGGAVASTQADAPPV